MKALSVRQPYAWAITMGFKSIENREWTLNNPGRRFRGAVLIHAGLREEKNDVDWVIDMVVDQTGADRDMIQSCYETHRALGAIVGTATVIDCVTDHPSPWFFGPVGLVLTDQRCCPPVPCKGALGFFNVSSDVLKQVRVIPTTGASPRQEVAHD